MMSIVKCPSCQKQINKLHYKNSKNLFFEHCHKRWLIEDNLVETPIIPIQNQTQNLPAIEPIQTLKPIPKSDNVLEIEKELEPILVPEIKKEYNFQCFKCKGEFDELESIINNGIILKRCPHCKIELEYKK